MPRSCCRRSISMRSRRASPISASPSTMPRSCRSPAPWSAAAGRQFAQEHAREGACRPQQEHGLVLRPAEPRRSDQDHGGCRASCKEDDVARSYDFLHKNEFFENTGKVSKTKMGALLKALKDLGDIEGSTDVERFVLPGVTQLIGLGPDERRRSGCGGAAAGAKRAGGLRIAAPRFYFAGILSVLGGLLFWELVSRCLVANPLFLAAPSQIVHGDLGARPERRDVAAPRHQRDRVRARLRHCERARA